MLLRVADAAQRQRQSSSGASRRSVAHTRRSATRATSTTEPDSEDAQAKAAELREATQRLTELAEKIQERAAEGAVPDDTSLQEKASTARPTSSANKAKGAATQPAAPATPAAAPPASKARAKKAGFGDTVASKRKRTTSKRLAASHAASTSPTPPAVDDDASTPPPASPPPPAPTPVAKTKPRPSASAASVASAASAASQTASPASLATPPAPLPPAKSKPRPSETSPASPTPSPKATEKPSPPEPLAASTTQEPPPPPKANPLAMNLVFVAAECSPWSKTGGLGDVVGGLPRALAARGHRLMVVAPRYGDYAEGTDSGVDDVRFPIDGHEHHVRYFQHHEDGVDWVFVDSPVFRGLHSIYQGHRDEVLRRNALLCRAAIEAPWLVPCGGVTYGDDRLVYVCNDWHTALLPVYLQTCYKEFGKLTFAKTTLILHNVAHQGRGPMKALRSLGIPEHCHSEFRLKDSDGVHANVLLAGMRYAQRLVAVSPHYAWEMRTPEGGRGLDSYLREHAEYKLTGIVNGVDLSEWSPDVDPFLTSDGYERYWTDTLDTGKAACKLALQREMALPERPEVPLLAFIGRLDDQKGVDVIAAALPWLLEQDVQLVMLGSGRADLEGLLRQAEADNPHCVRSWVGFSVEMAHRITAAADLLLMPSRFEPCGLQQLYGMRFGTVPVVHAVGGLRDTVAPFDPMAEGGETGLGWTFDSCDAQALTHAVGNALFTYREHAASFRAMQIRGMETDVSWAHAAERYDGVLMDALDQW